MNNLEQKAVIRQLVEIMNMNKGNALAKVGYLTRAKMNFRMSKEDFDDSLKMPGMTSFNILKGMSALDKQQFLYMACEMVETGGSSPQSAQYLVALQQELG